jgi:amino-acid N-acetyltransferase
VTITNPDAETLNQIRRLLKSVDLPVAGIEDMQVLAHFGEDNELVGILGIEDFGGDCLLRSLAVLPAHRRQGIGSALVTHLLAIMGGKNRTMYLFTESADRYMARFGFKIIPVERVPETIRSSTLIAAHCIANAKAMQLTVL